MCKVAATYHNVPVIWTCLSELYRPASTALVKVFSTAADPSEFRQHWTKMAKNAAPARGESNQLYRCEKQALARINGHDTDTIH